MNKNVLNKIIIEWNNSDIKDSGLLKASDINSRMKHQLIYTLNEQCQIKIFNSIVMGLYRDKFKDSKVYINGEYIQLNENGYTVNEYEPGEYYVYIDRFDEWEEIYSYAFYYCSGLTSITIPNSVKEIGYNAFRGCTGLVSITIPDSVIKIGESSFISCIGLTSITIPNSVKEIGDSAFRGCSGLTEATISDSVTMIGHKAFKNCINLKTVYVENIYRFNNINFEDEYSDPTYYDAEIIEKKL